MSLLAPRAWIDAARWFNRWPAGLGVGYVADAGLANRLRAWFFAHSLASLQGRQVVHRWLVNPACGVRHVDLFQTEPHAYNHLALPFLIDPPPHIATSPEGFTQLGYGRTHVVLSRTWQYCSAEHWISASWPSPELVSAFRRTVLGSSNRRESAIGVHLRLHDFGRRIPIDAFIAATERLLARLGNEHRIVLFSDQIEFALPAFQARFGNSQVEAADHADAAGKRRDPTGVRDALRSFRRLSCMAAAVLTPNSSFGQLATALGGLSGEFIETVE